MLPVLDLMRIEFTDQSKAEHLCTARNSIFRECGFQPLVQCERGAPVPREALAFCM